MLPRIASIAVVLGVVLVGRAEGPGPAHAGDLRHWDFKLDSVRYRILLPQQATLMTRSDGFSVSLSSRLVRQLHIRPAPGGVNAPHAHAEKLSSGAMLRYDIDRDVGGGSGGKEGRLEGVLRIGMRTLAVTCHEQDEMSPPSPEWCLPLLRDLRIDSGS